MTRVIDACAGFDRFWAFAASLSGFGVEAGVRDTVTGEAWFYTGLDAEPALDTAAFDTCAAEAAPAAAPPVPGGGAGGSGEAGAVSLGDRSGYLWFHRPGSPEVAVKAIDACVLDPPSFWLFASGLTTSEVRLTVTDTASAETREVFNPLGQAFRPVRDAGTFRSCP